MYSISKSLTFLLTIRETISEAVELCDLKPSEKEIVKSYFMNEATDYEVMHFFTTAELAKERFNVEKEAKLFEGFHKYIKGNSSILEKFVDKDILTSVMTEVGPISTKGLSSAVPILEFLLSNGMVNLSEQEPKETVHNKVKKAALSWGEKGFMAAKNKFGNTRDKLRKLALGNKIDALKNYFRGNRKRQAVAAGVIVALMSLAAVQIYRKKFSPAAKSCKQFIGPEKNACMKKFRLDALSGKLAALRSGIGACASSKEPDKCRASMQRKIQSLEAKIAKRSK